jgi:hypothetical protein
MYSEVPYQYKALVLLYNLPTRLSNTIILTIPQIFTRAKGPLAASAHEVGTSHVRVLIGCVFVEIVIESETSHIYRAVLLTI